MWAWLFVPDNTLTIINTEHTPDEEETYHDNGYELPLGWAVQRA